MSIIIYYISMYSYHNDYHPTSSTIPKGRDSPLLHHESHDGDHCQTTSQFHGSHFIENGGDTSHGIYLCK